MSLPSFYPPPGGWTRWYCRVLSIVIVCLALYRAFGEQYSLAAYLMALAVWIRLVGETDYFEDQ